MVYLTEPEDRGCTVCFKKSFTTLKVYVNLRGGYIQCFES
jgi:hypothetical protein